MLWSWLKRCMLCGLWLASKLYLSWKGKSFAYVWSGHCGFCMVYFCERGIDTNQFCCYLLVFVLGGDVKWLCMVIILLELGVCWHGLSTLLCALVQQC